MPMYPRSQLPKPLTNHEFYALLVLSRTQLHAYAIKGEVHKDSLGSIHISTGRLYELVARLHQEGYIEISGTAATDTSLTERAQYRTSAKGLIRLQEECRRLTHALEIAKNAGLLENSLPTDIQTLLLELS